MQDELKQIKKIYGEDMMHLCRETFPTLLDKKGKLLGILTKTFAPTHSLYKDLKDSNSFDDFKLFINTINSEDEKKLIVVKENPSELLAKVNYDLYECKTEEDIQSFKKYYKKGEEICTFGGGRLNRCHVFFAVKKNALDIKRDKFPNPKRQDAYGTSVISIQFSKDSSNTLSIKNRYNDTVDNPDATFFNNLEYIIPGLTKSFEYYYNLNINYKPKNDGSFLRKKMNYVKGNDNKYYRYNLIVDNCVYCENNIYLENGDPKLTYFNNKEIYTLVDNYIINRVDKKISLLNGMEDSFTKSITDIGVIKNIDLFRNRDNRLFVINYYDGKSVSIRIDEYNNIIEYENNYIKEIGDKFLKYNKGLLRLSLSKVEEIGNDCLMNNNSIKEVILSSVKNIGGNFLYYNKTLKELDLPNVELISYGCLFTNKILESFIAPNVRIIGNNSLYSNQSLKEIGVPNDTIFGLHCLSSNLYLSSYIEKMNSNKERRVI